VNAPEVISDAETAIELGDGWALYRFFDEAELRDPDGRVVLCGKWAMVPAYIQTLVSEAEAEARLPAAMDDDNGGRA
jgi:hypothetical protein